MEAEPPDEPDEPPRATASTSLLPAAAKPGQVPSLQSLALSAIAGAVHHYEPELMPSMPYEDFSAEVIKQLLASGRLRPETLNPLLADSSSASSLSDTLGDTLLNAAPTCRGLSQLAVQRLKMQQLRQKQQQQQQQRQQQQQQQQHHFPMAWVRKPARRKWSAIVVSFRGMP